ncbi:hypothetical protein [Rhodohalobacter mucosus]|uniref:Uncharacterized protein n=1 Tax=Rhodohalobacter mucosus TaxID=2079485 RepID=A0A316TY89_9BACT|nr:hypothetical protein [Rhodohalobacter mucosus]PWN07684.1 hypothetical protein DDZ15_01275 [Rhodohalobacter mucosus]
MGNKGDNKAFKQIMTWSLAMFFAAIVFGLLYRIIMPIERYPADDQFIEKVFVEFETVAWQSNREDADAAGAFEGGSILYVIREDSARAMVRPFIVSGLDSVWVEKNELTEYTPDKYREWQYEEERRKYDLD